MVSPCACPRRLVCTCHTVPKTVASHAGDEVGHGRHAPPVEVAPGEVVEQVAHAVHVQARQGRHRPRADARAGRRPAPAARRAPPGAPRRAPAALRGRAGPRRRPRAPARRRSPDAGAIQRRAAGGRRSPGASGAAARRSRRSSPAGGGQPGLRRAVAAQRGAAGARSAPGRRRRRGRGTPVRCSCRSTLRTRSTVTASRRPRRWPASWRPSVLAYRPAGRAACRAWRSTGAGARAYSTEIR